MKTAREFSQSLKRQATQLRLVPCNFHARFLLIAAMIVVALQPSRSNAQTTDLSYAVTPWFSVAMLGGVSVPLPLSTVPLKIERYKLVTVPELEVHLGHRFSTALAVSIKKFGRYHSLYKYVQQKDFYAKCFYAPIVSETIVFAIFLSAGMVAGEKFYEQPVSPKETGSDTLQFIKVRTELYAPLLGLGLKFAYYPADFFALNVQTSILYRISQDLKLYEGAATAQFLGGAELHF